MDHKLSVTVQIDLDGKHIRILIAGCLTKYSQAALLPVIRRARYLTPGVLVSLDASPARHIDNVAVDLLRDSMAQEASLDKGLPVEFLLPEPLPHHGDAPPNVLSALVSDLSGVESQRGAA